MVYDVKFVSNIRDMFESSVSDYPDNIAFLYKDDEMNVVKKTYSETYRDVKRLASFLNSHWHENQKIALIGINCYEWAVSYLAVCCGVGVIVPIDRELKTAELNNILESSGVSAIIYSDDVSNTVNAVEYKMEKFPMSDFKAIFDSESYNTDSYNRHKIDPNALSVLLYTSGTTGVSKGVMLSQYNICADIIGVCKGTYVGSNDRTLSVLPLHHTYECTAGFLSMIYAGASIAFAESLRKFPSDMKLFKPTLIVAVPLLIENIHAHIMKKVNSSGLNKLIFQIGKGIKPIFGSERVFKQIHETFGGNLRGIVCGAAALSPEISRDFKLFGFDIYCGYGLTETSPVCIMHNDNNLNPNNVGQPISGVQVKLENVNADGVGELYVKGRNVMLGYYENPEETAKVLSPDGWFNTGDLAMADKNGCYKIVGRIKNMIVLTSGKKIFPEELEYYLKKSHLVKECMVYGDGDTITALIFPDFEIIKASGDYPTQSDIEAEYLKSLFAPIVKEANMNLPSYKFIRQIRIRKSEFIKTTTKKIRRNLEQNYDE